MSQPEPVPKIDFEASIPQHVSVDLVLVAVQRVTRLLNESGISYAQISQEFKKYFPGETLPAENIRKFVQRARDKYVVSDTLGKLYSYIQKAKADFPPFVRENVILHLNVFFERDPDQGAMGSGVDASYGFFVANAYRLLSRMLHTNYDHSRMISIEIEGAYMCMRPSTRFPKSERIVVSYLTIGPKPQFPEVVEFQHYTESSLGEYRASDGFVISLNGNIFLIGDIEYGRGLEMIVLQRPAVPKSRFLVGLLLSLDTNSVPMCSKIVMVKRTEDIAQADHFRPILGPRNTTEVFDDFSVKDASESKEDGADESIDDDEKRKRVEAEKKKIFERLLSLLNNQAEAII